MENNQALVGRLEQLVEVCEEDETHFMGKDGLNEIALTLNVWFTRIDKNGKNKGRTMAKSVRNINDHLGLLELPYEIIQIDRKQTLNGKRRTVNYYIVVPRGKQKEELLTEEEIAIVLASRSKSSRRRW